MGMGAVHADSAGYRCVKGKMSLPKVCKTVPKLERFLNQMPFEPLDVSQVDEALLIECLQGVRKENLDLKGRDHTWCAVADDRAFGLLMNLRQNEVRQYQARRATKDGMKQVNFVDPQCFGTLCYKIPDSYHKVTYPMRE